MNINIDYYLIYSSMTETTSALIALVGIFLIFHIQLQRERLGRAYENLKQFVFLDKPPVEREYPSDAQIVDKSHDLLDKQNLSEEASRKEAIKREEHTTQTHKKLLTNTIKTGVFILISISLLCGFFIISLYLPFFHNVYTLLLSLLSSLTVLSCMVYFIVKTILAAGWDAKGS